MIVTPAESCQCSLTLIPRSAARYARNDARTILQTIATPIPPTTRAILFNPLSR